MQIEWSLREEVLRATQRWPWLVSFCLLGACVGWLISIIIPTPHRATRELYVGLNVYRATEDRTVSQYAGIKLVNANDYKNWQMASLNALIFMDPVVSETLLRLQKVDPYWNGVSVNQLADWLHVYWRNAGKWHLVAEHKNPRLADEAVTIWQDVVLDFVHQAVIDSQAALIFELQLKSLAESKSRLLEKAIQVKHARQRISKIYSTLDKRPPGDLLNPTEYWEIWRTLSNLDLNIAYDAQLDSIPDQNAPISEIQTWVNEILPVLDQELDVLDQQIQEIIVYQNQTADQFANASQKSYGLSASLDVDRISDSPTEKTATRPTGVLMLIGSLLGLITWLTLWVSSISLRGKA